MHSRRCTALAVLSPLLLSMFGCASLRSDPVEAYVVGIEPLQGAGLELRMLVRVRVQNPNEAPIHYDGVSVSMTVQGKRLASGVSDAAGTIPRFGESIIDVPVSMSALRFVGRAIEVLGPEASGDIEYELRGKLSGPALNTVRFKSKGQIDLPAGMAADDGEGRH